MIKNIFSINYFVNFTKTNPGTYLQLSKRGNPKSRIFFIKLSYRNTLAIYNLEILILI